MKLNSVLLAGLVSIGLLTFGADSAFAGGYFSAGALSIFISRLLRRAALLGWITPLRAATSRALMAASVAALASSGNESCSAMRPTTYQAISIEELIESLKGAD